MLIPVKTASRRLFNRDYVTMLIAQLKDPSRSNEATEKVAALLRERHHIQPLALDDFAITNPAATMARVARANTTLSRILTGVAIMALLIGGIVIMSLMSIAVSERRKEIGVRRSVGVARNDIVVQFLFEATFVALAGGIAGALIGWVAWKLRAVSRSCLQYWFGSRSPVPLSCPSWLESFSVYIQPGKPRVLIPFRRCELETPCASGKSRCEHYA